MKEEIEIWQDIQGYENLYQCSSLGRVKSLWFGKEKILKQIKDKNAYCRVILYKEGKIKSYLVHRLVALHFIPNPQIFSQVNHKDENPSNNCVENLEWCTAKYNCNYGTYNEKCRKAKKNKSNLTSSKSILQFSKSGNIILGKWDSISQASKELNIKCSNICTCCKGKYKTCGGYRWMYLEDYVNRMEKLYNLALKNVS